MNEIILLKLGEVVLKGLNRRSFEDKLLSNIRRRLQPLYHLEETINRQQIPSSYPPIDNRRHTLSLSYALFVILSSTALLSTVFQLYELQSK